MNTGRSLHIRYVMRRLRGIACVALAVFALLVVPAAQAAPATQISAASLHDNSEVPPPDAAAWAQQTLPDN